MSVQTVVIISPWKINKAAELCKSIKHTHKNNILINVRKIVGELTSESPVKAEKLWNFPVL